MIGKRTLSVLLALTIGLASAALLAAPERGREISSTTDVIVTPSDEKKEAAESEEEGPPGDINWVDFGNKAQPPLLALLINFGLLVFIYYRFGKGPILQGLKDRRDAISKDIDQAAMILREAQARAETYQAKLEKKEEDAEAARTGLALAGKGEKEHILKEADEKAARLKRDAVFLAGQEIKQMQIDLVKETVERAIAEAETLLAKGVTQADQERLAEEYLSTLGTQKTVGAA